LEHGLKFSLEYFRQAVAEAIAKTGATKKEQRA
jgi:hypothetical protein